MKGIVIYKGKYGATAQYAKWLAEALYLPAFDLEKQLLDNLDGYDGIMIGSPVYMGKLLIKDWLSKNADVLHHKKVFLFVVCGSAGNKHKQDDIIRQNIPAGLENHCEIYFLPGRVDMSKLSWYDRLIIYVGAFFEKDPQKKQLMRRGYDAVKREHINPLIKDALHYSNTEEVI
ncbi:MAG: hypothetical protein JSU01_21720 [Bacteroidetes bacterium]|nr:hypothetical protein [Bacteroidota bacterium]